MWVRVEKIEVLDGLMEGFGKEEVSGKLRWGEGILSFIGGEIMGWSL